MENFEYSILLNDRDWAEFDLASEECSLIPPALATAEDQVPSDLEEGDAEENRLVRVKVSPPATHDAAKCLSREAPASRLLAEDVMSGREDGISLASANPQAGAAFSPPGCTRAQQRPGASSEPSRNPGRLARLDTGERPIHPGCPSAVVAGLSLLQVQSLGHLRAERLPPAGYMSPGTTERMENPTGGKWNDTPLPQNETVSLEVSFPTSIERTAASEHAERATYGPPESLGAQKSTEKALVLKDKKGDEGTENVSCRVAQERGQADYGRRSACVKAEHPFLAGQEGNVHLNATLAADSSWGETLDRPRETVGLARIAEKSNHREPCRHLGMEIPDEEETDPVVTGGRRPDLGEPSILCGLTLNRPPESSFTDITWPEMYDYFFCDNTKEEGGKTERDGGLVPFTATELPDMYGPEYFFHEMDAGTEGRSRDKASGTFLGLDRQSTLHGGSGDSRPTADTVHISTPEVYEHFFADGAKDRRTWKGLLLRATAAEAKKAARALQSFLSGPVRRLRSQPPTSRGTPFRRGSQGRLVLLSTRILDERPEAGEMAVMQPERPSAIQPVLTQRDMCLGFVAFASWAVKTSDLQAPDAWKIVLLANFGTLSAIRYFRRQVVTERWQDS